MSSNSQPSVNVEEAFLDTSILYDYTKDKSEPAKRLFKTHQQVVKVTSKFGKREYRKVAERRHRAIKEWEDHSETNPIADFDFGTLSWLTDNDRKSLRRFRDKLVQNHGKQEALRLMNKRKRNYDEGVRKLFTNDENLVEVQNLKMNPSLEGKFQIDINNGSDRKLFCHAADWHSKGSGNAFLTSDRDDFSNDSKANGSNRRTDGSGLPDGLEAFGKPTEPLVNRLNDHINSCYSATTWLHILTTEEYLKEI